MPYVNIKITNEQVSTKDKQKLIVGVTELLVSVLNKNPQSTVVIIDEVSTVNWGIGGKAVSAIRQKK